MTNDPRGRNGFAGVRRAWEQLDRDARYYFQTLAWMESVAGLIGEDAVWDVVAVDAENPAAVSLVQRSRPSRAGIPLRVVSDVRVGDMGYATDCLVGSNATTSRVLEVDDLLRACGDWDILHIRSRRTRSPWIELASKEGWVQEEREGGVGILDTRRGADEWRQSLPKNMRDSVRKGAGGLPPPGAAK